MTLNEARVGWVAGGGIEHAFNRSWSLRVEGLYYDFGKDSVTKTPFNTHTYTTTFRHRIAVARAGLQLRW